MLQDGRRIGDRSPAAGVGQPIHPQVPSPLHLDRLNLAQQTARIEAGALGSQPSGYVGVKERTDLINKSGTAVTDLHPSGKAKIEAETVEVVTEGEFIEKGCSVEVINVEAMRVVVREKKET